MICPFCAEYDVNETPKPDSSGMCQECQEYSIPESEDEEQ